MCPPYACLLQAYQLLDLFYSTLERLLTMALWLWHEETAATLDALWPSPRRSHGACFLESSETMLVFGGYANDSSIFKDTWLLNVPAGGSSPSQPIVAERACTAQLASCSPEGPCKRHDHCVASYSDSVACRVFIFGGYTSTLYNHFRL